MLLQLIPSIMVYYKPRTSQFIVGVNKYLEAVKNGFTVGMRFRMRFEGEDVPEKRFTGTIVGVEDISSQWAGSKWRSLRVPWDEAANVQRPERVFPWEIEPFDAPTPALNLPKPVSNKIKRPREPMENADLSAPESTSVFWYSGAQSHDLTALSCNGGQSCETQVVWPCMQKENKGHGLKNGPNSDVPVTVDDWLKDFHSPRKNPPSSLSDVPLKLFQDMRGEEKVPVPLWSVNTVYKTEEPALKLGNGVEQEKKHENRSSGYRLFGIELLNHSPATAEKVILEPVTKPKEEV